MRGLRIAPAFAPPRPRPSSRTSGGVLAMLLLVGCGMTAGKGNPPGELDSVDLAPSPGWPDAIAARSVPASFRTAITALEVDPRGRVWVLRDELSDPSQLDGTPVLERYGCRALAENVCRAPRARDAPSSAFGRMTRLGPKCPPKRSSSPTTSGRSTTSTASPRRSATWTGPRSRIRSDATTAPRWFGFRSRSRVGSWRTGSFTSTRAWSRPRWPSTRSRSSFVTLCP